MVYANRLKPAMLGDGLYEEIVDSPTVSEKELEKSHNHHPNKISNETDDQ